jgi:glycosyltransferase involved in cell wall biosynthesis
MERSIAHLGVYVDGPLRVVQRPDGQLVTAHPADFPFLVFLSEISKHFDSLVLFARTEHVSAVDDFVVIPPGIQIEELPYYTELFQLGRVAAVTPGTIAAFWRGLRRMDGVWVFGPHPFGLLLVVLATLRCKPAILGVRQNTAAYFEARLPSRRWAPVLLPLRAVDAAFRLFARRLKTVVAGPDIESRYGGERPRLLVMADSLVSEVELAAEPRQQNWTGTLQLLTVGRLDAEKNPLLLVQTMAEFERRSPGRYRLTWVGGGPLEGAVRQRVAELGITDQVKLHGWVTFGPALLDLYRRSHLFVHVSLTEGVPRVLFEAMACATPIVATEVGGVRGLLDGGRAGLLVPPDDEQALVMAIERMTEDAELRDQLVRRGLELARGLTLEAQAARVARFIAAGL